MGIKGLPAELRTFLHINGRHRNLNDFRGNIIGVDLSIWLNQAIHSPATKVEFASNFVAIPPVDISRQICAFLDGKWAFFDQYGIKLLLVADGSRNPLKKGTNDARQMGPAQAKAEFETYLTSDALFDESTLQKHAQKSVYVREDVLLAAIEWANRNEIRFCCAPIEAEWQLLSLEEQGIIDAILTIDSDTFIGGGKNCYHGC